MREPFGRRSKHEICIGQLIPSFEAAPAAAAGRLVDHPVGRKANSRPWPGTPKAGFAKAIHTLQLLLMLICINWHVLQKPFCASHISNLKC